MPDLQETLEENDFTLHIPVSNDLGNKLTRSEIEAALASVGKVNNRDRDFTFHISDNEGGSFVVSYMEDGDFYSYTKRKRA